jgi:hypothetical protein
MCLKKTLKTCTTNVENFSKKSLELSLHSVWNYHCREKKAEILALVGRYAGGNDAVKKTDPASRIFRNTVRVGFEINESVCPLHSRDEKRRGENPDAPAVCSDTMTLEWGA